MGLTDAVGGAIDKAAAALGSSDSKSGPKPDAGTPEFVRKDALDPDKEKPAMPAGTNGGDTDPTTKKTPDIIEFVHYGYVHADTTDHFVHPKFDPDKKDDKTDDKNKDGADKDKDKDKKPAGRGIMFRDAVEREMVLLHGYISATKSVHEELQKNAGLVGAASAAIGSLIGDSGKEPVPGSLQHLLDNITTAGDTINADSCEYIKIHKAAIDIHQTRADYTKYCKEKLYAYYIDQKGSGKDGKSPTAILTSLPGVAGAAKTVFGLLFKAFDIYFAMFLMLRDAYEREIENICHDFSIKVVKEYSVPTYACWFGKAKEKKKPDKSTMPSVLGDAENKYNEGKQDVDDAIGYEEKKPAPGEDVINAIFDLLGKGPGDKDKKDGDPADPKDKDATKDKPKPNPADGVVNAAFKAIISDKIPDILLKAVSKIVWANLRYLKVVYLKLCKEPPTAKIDIEWLNERAIETLSDPLYSFIEDSVGFIKKIEDANFDVLGQKVGPQKLVDKGKDALTAKLAGYCNPVLKLAVGRLAKVFEDARSDADKNKLLTMEVFIARLPYFLAFQVRNCTFPMWKTIIDEELVGKGGGALTSALKPVTDFLGDAKGFMADAKDYKDRAGKVMDKYDKDGTSLGTGGQNLTGYKDLITTSTKKDDDATKGGKFPGGTRTITGTGTKIPADDIDKAKKDQKDPWPS